MTTKTTTRPSPRSSHGHSQSHSSRTPTQPSTTPHSPPVRMPPSVGQALPPIPNTHLRSPAIQTDPRTPSPNYFGLAVNSENDPRDSGRPKDNWSPPTSSIRSFGAASSQNLPINANPDFEAFRRQAQSMGTFNLGHGNLSHFASTPGVVLPRSKADRRSVDTQESASTTPRARHGTSDNMDLDGGQDKSTTKHTSDSFFDLPRHESPAQMTMSPVQRNTLSHLDERHPRLSLPTNKVDPPSYHSNMHKTHQASSLQRADTLPAALEDGPALISPKQLKDIMEGLSSSQFLLLDLRVNTQFSESRITDALNLCIPTTLLKRPSFNIQKLQETFTSDAEKKKFAQWKDTKFIVVYDAFSSEMKDAISSVHALKKFAIEGWKGESCILRGGFREFSKHFPELVDRRSSREMQSISLSLGTQMPQVAPVAGGCAMPPTKNAVNPFFGNIRQNQDLIGGVGQMDVKIPAELSSKTQAVLPSWLAKASDKDDHGKRVADKFLHLELAEQSRMTKALSSGISYGTPGPHNQEVQIAGMEKGTKNRYNNIWPFEHARVRVQGRANGACDYVNASHIGSSRSNKRYIASQGPLPTTFEDFWSVIWDQDVRVIVMLTAEQEGGQLKCHPYWSSQDYGSLRVKNLSEKKISLDTASKKRTSPNRRDVTRRRATTVTDKNPLSTDGDPPHAIVRKFTLAHSNHPFTPIREITQIHYASWPDFGAPASPNQLLALVELSNQVQRAAFSATQSTRSSEPENDSAVRPMLVHCSAGCGRTGTFCTIDTVIDMLKRQRRETKSGITPMDIVETAADSGGYLSKGKDDADQWVFDADIDLVQKTVEEFRSQRLSMVQSLRQYVLCYETILEWIAQQNLGGVRSGRERSGSEV